MPFEPEAGEEESAFMSRCLEHHGDKPHDQALAICLRIWGERSFSSIAKAYEKTIKSEREWFSAKSSLGKILERDRVIISNETTDRDGEVILFSAWRNKGGERIPMLYGHDNFSIDHAIGTFEIERSEDGKALLGKMHLAENDAGRKAEALLATGFNTVSVGFLPFKWSDDYGKTYVSRDHGDPFPWPRKGRIYHDVEAVECSMVPVPSNPEARVLEADDVQKLVDQIMPLLTPRVIDALGARKEVQPAWWQDFIGV